MINTNDRFNTSILGPPENKTTSKFVCILESFNTNIYYHVFNNKISFVNSHQAHTNSKDICTGSLV